MPKIFSEQDRETIRQKLLNAGLKELSHKPYRSISIDSIAAEAGIAKGTFYHFFPSKETCFYEIMQFIKEQNREDLRKLLLHDRPSRSDIVNCLYHRYTQIKTVYDYFTPEEMKLIVRKLPDGDSADDSVEFAEWICGHLSASDQGQKAKVIVNMCNIMALASSNREMLEQSAYEETILIFCNTIADYILKEERESI